MKALFGFLAIFLAANLSHADADKCVDAAEEAAYNKWYDPNAWAIGDVQNGATSVVWERDGVISYQVSIQWRKPDSSNISWANYSVRVRESDCSIVKIRKF